VDGLIQAVPSAAADSNVGQQRAITRDGLASCAMSDRGLEAVIRVFNLTGVFLCTRAGRSRSMLQAAAGRIINTPRWSPDRLTPPDGTTAPPRCVVGSPQHSPPNSQPRAFTVNAVAPGLHCHRDDPDLNVEPFSRRSHRAGLAKPECGRRRALFCRRSCRRLQSCQVLQVDGGLLRA